LQNMRFCFCVMKLNFLRCRPIRTDCSKCYLLRVSYWMTEHQALTEIRDEVL
jgi:hypothetical protein